MQLHDCSRESGFKEAYKSIYILHTRYARFPGGCDLADFRKCAFGAIINWILAYRTSRRDLKM